MSELARQQQWLVRAITAVTPVPPQHLGGAAVPAELGLHIYRHAYRARLEECLADDYPAVKSLLGDDIFSALAARTIADYPPRAATLNRYGRRLVQTIRHASAQYGRQAVDLARLEWALCVALHAPPAPQMDPQIIAKLPPARLPNQRFHTAPSLQIIASSFPIDSNYRQYLRGEPVIPIPRRAQAAASLPIAQTVAVLRTANGLERIVFSTSAGRILRRLHRGLTIAEALAGITLPPADIQSAFALMVAKGCLIALADGPRQSPRNVS